MRKLAPLSFRFFAKIKQWTSEQENFLRKYQKEPSRKKVAIFVSCGSVNPLSEGEQKKKEMDEGRRKYLEEIAAKYNLEPISVGSLVDAMTSTRCHGSSERPYHR